MKKSILLISFLAATIALVFYVTTENQKVEESSQNEEKEVNYSGPAQFEMIHRMIRTTEGETEPQYKTGDRVTELKKALSNVRLTKSGEDYNWIERGPANVGGRTRGLIVDPDDPSFRTWFAASVGGGVWKTENAGQSWRLLTDNLTSLATSSIAMSPANTDVIYVGTGEGIFSLPAIIGTGIWKSMDKGETWEVLESTSTNQDFAYITRMVVNPANENEVLVSTVSRRTGASYIYKSLDGGETWDRKLQLSNFIQQIVATPQDFNTIYASVNSVGVYKSEDAGETWSSVWSTPNQERRIEMAVSNQDAGVIYLSCEIEDGSRLYFTRDTFNTISETIYKDFEPNWLARQGWYDNTIAVHPYNDNLVWVAGQSSIMQLEPGTELGSVLRYDDYDNNTDFIDPIEDGPFVDEAGGLASTLFAGLPVSFELEDGDLVEAEIRFGDGIKSMAHLVSITNPVTFEFGYSDFIEVPFQVWDIENNIQLASTVVDGDFSGDWSFSEYNGGQLLDATIVNALEYSEEPNPRITDSNPFYKALYFFLASKSSDFEGNIDSLPAGEITFTTRVDEGIISTFTPITDGYFDYFDVAPVGPKGVHVDHHNIIFIPQDEATQSFYVLNANDGGVAFSEDSGETFIQTGDTFNDGSFETSKGYNTAQFYGIDKMNGSNRFIAGSQDNGSWISNPDPDENSNWVIAPSGDGFEAAWNYGNTNLILESSQFNNIFKSFDEGLTWENVELPESQGPFVTRIASSQLAPDLVFMVSDTGVLRSIDFGDSWEIIEMPEEWEFNRSWGPPITISLADPSVVWTGSSINFQSRICYSDDGGLNFNSTPNYTLAQLGTVTGIATHPSDPNTAYALFSQANSPKILKTEDLGQTWTDISGFINNVSQSSNGFPNVATYSLIVMPWNEDIIWAGTEIGIFESIDGGLNWEYADNNLPPVSVWQMKLVNDELVLATHGRGIWTLNTSELDPVSVNDFEQSDNYALEAYPNPVGDFTTISFKVPIGENCKVSLYDINGKLVKSIYNQKSNQEEQTVRFDRDNLESGNYLLKLSTNKESLTKKLILG